MVRSIERTRRGFVIHTDRGSAAIRVRAHERREVEAAFRGLGVVVVDQWGARIDDTQFAKEADPALNRNVGPGFFRFLALALTPNWYLAWRRRRYVRQSSDNA